MIGSLGMVAIAGCSFSLGDEQTGAKIEISSTYGDGIAALEAGKDEFEVGTQESESENYDTAADGYERANAEFADAAGLFSDCVELFSELDDVDGRDICIESRDGAELFASSAESLATAMAAANAGDQEEANSHIEAASVSLDEAQQTEIRDQSELRTALGLGDSQQGP